MRKGINKINKKFTPGIDSGISVNNETKYIIKVIISLENIVILLKGTTKKITRQKGRLLNFLGSLVKTGLLLIKPVLTLLTKFVSVTSELRATASATDATIQKKIFGSGCPAELVSQTTKLIFPNEESNDIIKMVESLKDSCLLIKVF